MGVGGPLLKIVPRVSSLSPSRENHLLELAGAAANCADCAGKGVGWGCWGDVERRPLWPAEAATSDRASEAWDRPCSSDSLPVREPTVKAARAWALDRLKLTSCVMEPPEEEGCEAGGVG